MQAMLNAILALRQLLLRLGVVRERDGNGGSSGGAGSTASRWYPRPRCMRNLAATLSLAQVGHMIYKYIIIMWCSP